MGPLKRKAVLTRDGWQCHYCKRPLTKRTGTVDHKIPKSRGGDHSMGNLVACCEPCNTRKADMDYEAFVALPIPASDEPLKPVHRGARSNQTLGKLPAGATRDIRLDRKDTVERTMWGAITADRHKC